jgi:hypothetical protein
MNLERYTTADGWPGLRWEQEVPTGQTAFAVSRGRQFKIAGVAGLMLFVVILVSGGGPVAATLLALLGVGLVAAPGPFEGVSVQPAEWMGIKIGPWRLSEAEREARARQRVTPLYAKESWRAEVAAEAGATAADFLVWQEEKSGPRLVHKVALLSFGGMDLSTAEEWFGDLAERELVRLRQVPQQWVIVAVTQGHGVLLIARSGRDKAALAEVHEALVAEFIGRRKEILEQLEMQDAV